jgi:subtilisin family serine protease
MASRGSVVALVLAIMVSLFPPAATSVVVGATPDGAAPGPARPAGDPQPPEPVSGPGPIAAPGTTVPGATVCEHVDGRVLVRFRDATPARARPAYATVDGRRVRSFQNIPGLELLSTSLPVREAARRLQADPSVLFVEPDCTLTLDAVPDDALFGQLWGLVNTGQNGGTPGADIGAAEAWDVRTDASAITVAVIDSGMQRNHPDLSLNAWTNSDEVAGNGTDDDGNGYVDDRIGWDWANGDADPADDNGHGTHVAGTIGARGDNGVGVVGVAWRVRLMALKAMGADGSGSTSAVISAVDYAVANGAHIINASFGSTSFSRSLYDAFEAAGEQGVLTVAAAGNDAVNTDELPHYPASFGLATIVSVGATNRSDDLADFSNYGIHSVDVAAPGAVILSTLPGSQYGFYSGTSMATPHVAGVAALLAAEHPSWSPVQLRERIVGTSRAVAALDGKAWAAGVVDAGAALGGGPTVLPPGPPTPTPVDLSPASVADPAPEPLAPPTPPSLPTPEVIEDSPADLAEPRLRFDSAGAPFVAYIRRFDGARIATRLGNNWVDRGVTSAYDEMFNLDLAIGPDDVPKLAIQRLWTSLDVYSDPGIIAAAAPSSGPLVERVSAACPQAASCYWDRDPTTDVDAAGAQHVAFMRGEVWDQDMVKASSGGAVPGDGLYYATDAGGDWDVVRVIADIDGGPPELAVEADGTAHLVVPVRDGSASGLYYVTNDGGSWTSLQLTHDVHDATAGIAVDALGGVHVVRSRLGIGVWYQQRSAAGVWSTPVQIVDAATYRASLALDGAGKAHVAVAVMDGFNFVDGVRYLTNESGTWTSKTVGGTLAAYPSIDIDPSGKVGIAYLEYTADTGQPLGIYVALESGASFATSMVRALSDEAGGGNLAHALDADGHSHVVLARGWWDAEPGVWYATNASGTWQLQKIAHGWPNAVAIAVDGTGRPHVAYSQMPQEQVGPVVSRRVAYAVRTNGTWAVQTVAGGSYGDGVAIALDAAGSPNVVFAGSGGATLRHARRSGSGWTVQNAYSGPGFQIRQPAALIDPSGVLHVAFDAQFSGVAGSRLLYAKRSGSTWTSAIVASGGIHHFYPSIARAPSGALWIADFRMSGPSVADGVWAYTSSGGAWTATNIGPDEADTHPSLAVDAEGRVRIAWARGWFYSSSGCSVPMCAIGPGLRESVFDGATWTTTKLTAHWHDIYPRVAAGPGGAVRIVWYRIQTGLRALQQAADVRVPSAQLKPSRTITTGPNVSYAVRFSETITGLTAADFSRTGTATGCVIGTPTGIGRDRTVVVTGCSDGTLILRLAALSVTNSEATDGPLAPVVAATVTIDSSQPTVPPPPASPRSSGPGG